MRPVAPPEEMGGTAVVFAKDQPEYLQLPARTDGQCVVTMWELTAVERAAVLAGAPILLQVVTFGSPLQPVSLTVRGIEEEQGKTE